MRVAVFSSKPYDRQFLSPAAKRHGHELVYFEPRLAPETSPLAAGFRAVCAFVNDQLDRATLTTLQQSGVELIALRCAGFNHVDMAAVGELGVRVVRVPAYSPYSVAEHTLGLILALNRKLHKAFNRVRENNFALDGLLGFDLAGRTAGVVGVGQIGLVVARLLHGFGCRVLLFDRYPRPDAEAYGEYVDPPTLLTESDIVTLHCPLTPETHYLVNAKTIAAMKRGVMLINTSRGGLVDTRAVIEGLKAGHIGYLGLDVYEEEEGLFFEDLSGRLLYDDVFARLLTFPNVLVTAHQAFFTSNALESIAETTMQSLSQFAAGEPLANEISLRR